MSILFTGSTDQKSLNEFTVQVPNPADKIRRQGLEILKGLEKNSQLQQNRSQQILQALKEKAQIESDYRRKAYEQEMSDNLRVAKDFQRNAQTKIANKRQEAENVGRKYKAYADILGASGQFIQAASDITAKRQKKRDEALMRELKITTPEAAAKFQADWEKWRNVKDYQDKTHKEIEDIRKELNISPSVMEVYIGASSREMQANFRAVARGLGNQAANIIAKSTWTNEAGVDIAASLEAFRKGDGIQNHENFQNDIKSFKEHAQKTYGSHITPKHWEEFVEPQLDRFFDDKHFEATKAKDRRASRRQSETYSNLISDTIHNFRNTKEFGGPKNIFVDQSKLLSTVLHKLLIKDRPDNYTPQEWADVQETRFAAAIRGQKMRRSVITTMRTSQVINDPAGKQGDGTWENRSPRMRRFFDNLDSIAREVEIEEGKRMQEETTAIKRRKEFEVTQLDEALAQNPLNRGEALQQLSKWAEEGDKQHLIKHLASRYTIKPNGSDINKELAKYNIKSKKAEGLLLASDVIKLTKHLDPVDQAEILTWLKKNGGDGFTELHEKITRDKKAGENRIKRNGNFLFQGRPTLAHESVEYKVKQFKREYDERLLAFIPDAAKELEGSNLSPKELQKRTLILAAEKAWQAFEEEWKASKGEKDGKYSRRQDEEEPSLREYTFTPYGEGAYQPKEGEKVYTGDQLNEFKSVMSANPEALTDPKVPNFLSRNELVNAVHAINRGDAFVPTRSMQALAGSVSIDGKRNNVVGFLLGELEKYQRTPGMPKLELNDIGKNHPAFKYQEVENHLPDPVKATVGQDKSPSIEGTQILQKQLVEPTYWSNLTESSASYLRDAPQDVKDNVNMLRERGGFEPLTFEAVEEVIQ